MSDSPPFPRKPRKRPDGAPRPARSSPAAGDAPGLAVRLIFGLPFAAAGLMMFALITLPPLLGWFRSRAWVETPARVTSASLDVYRGHKGGESLGVAVTYEYDFAGRRHTGNRYDFSTGPSGLEKTRTRRAVEALRENPSVVCLVNPENPGEAVLSRRPPLGAYAGIPAGLLFTGAGVWVMRGGVKSRVNAGNLRRPARRTREKGRPVSPASPASGAGKPETFSGPFIDSGERRRERARGTVLVPLVVFSFLLLFSLPLFDLADAGASPAIWVPLALIPGAGGFFLLRFLTRTFRTARRPEWTLALSRSPGTAGGPVEVSFRVVNPRPEDAMKTWSIRIIVLACRVNPRTRRPFAPGTGLLKAKKTRSNATVVELAGAEAVIRGDSGRATLEVPPFVLPEDKHPKLWKPRQVVEVDDQSGLVEREELRE